jgi:hypothetical protein
VQLLVHPVQLPVQPVQLSVQEVQQSLQSRPQPGVKTEVKIGRSDIKVTLPAFLRKSRLVPFEERMDSFSLELSLFFSLGVPPLL